MAVVAAVGSQSFGLMRQVGLTAERLTRTSVPPAPLASWTSPSRASTPAATMDSPNPLPPEDRLRDSSAREKRSKAWG